MIVDFHHHFTPRALMREDPGDRLILTYDETGAPSYTTHRLLFDLDAHIAMMDAAGIDAAMLSSASGMDAPAERCAVVQAACREAVRDYPGRFFAFAHIDPRGGPGQLDELRRCASEDGVRGVVITSEPGGKTIDDPALDPFWAVAEQLGLFVFVHPALKLSAPEQFDSYDLARSVGREFSLVMATIRLIDSGLFDRHPKLVVQMSHLGGGLAALLARIRSYQDKDFWGTAGNPRHGRLPAHDFDHYLNNNMLFDTGGFCGAIAAVKGALLELAPGRLVFGTDYPQEIRTAEISGGFVQEIAALGAPGTTILHAGAKLLLGV